MIGFGFTCGSIYTKNTIYNNENTKAINENIKYNNENTKSYNIYKIAELTKKYNCIYKKEMIITDKNEIKEMINDIEERKKQAQERYENSTGILSLVAWDPVYVSHEIIPLNKYVPDKRYIIKIR